MHYYFQIDIQPGNYYKVLAALYRQKREEELSKLFTINNFDEK